MEPVQNVQFAIDILQYATPLVVLLYFAVAITHSICNLQTQNARDQGAPRRAIFAMMLLVLVIYIAEAVVITTQICSGHGDNTTTSHNIYVMSTALAWLILCLSLTESSYPVWHPYQGSWCLSLICETILWVLDIGKGKMLNRYEWARFGIAIFRLCMISVLFALSAGICRQSRKLLTGHEEAAALLVHTQGSSESTMKSQGQGMEYGSIGADNPAKATPEDEDEDEIQKKNRLGLQRVKDRLRQNGSWWTYVRGFMIFIPHVWPANQRHLQIRIYGIGICLLSIRALNILVPRQLGIVVDSLSHFRVHMPILELCLFVVLRWAVSSTGLYAVKDSLYIPVELNCYQAIQTAAYNHILGLSADFHDSKQSGELFQSVHQGISVIDLLEAMVFSIAPMFVDLFLAFVYLYYLFNAYMALIAATTVILYVWAATKLTVVGAESQRKSAKVQRKVFQVMFDTLNGWRTVSYFNRINHEQHRYLSAMISSTKAKKHVYFLHLVARWLQSLLLDIGLLGACFFAAYQVVWNKQSVGKFVTLLTIWSQLTGPLSYLGSMHRQIVANLINAEQLLRLFQTRPKVYDGPKEFILKSGKIVYDHVDFAYDNEKQILNNLSFEVEPGETIAFIGETGGGKSTILKTLFRLYDVNKGSVLIDGQDVRHVTLQSLRANIAVVPQDPTMFNDTILSNLRYARLDATEADIIEACRAAAIHDKVLTFPEGYNSIVGEQGVKLSGGELQRIAIARAILKDPQIMLLDEATSSVDSETEQKIQESLSKLAKGRTTLIVAHRLSTVENADRVIVIRDGAILEQGPPKKLLATKGHYYLLWSKQMGIRGATPSTLPQEQPAMDEASKEGQSRDETNPLNKNFRPDAPEFVPLYQRGTASKGGDASHAHNNKAHGSSHGKEASQDFDMDKKQKSRKRKPNLLTRDSVGQSGDGSMDTSLTPAEPAKGAKDSEPKHKRTRLYRRHHNKSEPANKQSLGQEDGSTEMEIAPSGSGEGRAMLNTLRRVTAPSDPSAATNVGPGTNTHGSRRRRRHWKVRHTESTASQSGNQTSKSSGDWSANTSRITTPIAHTTSPAEGYTASDRLATIHSGNVVRFALDP